MDTRRDDNVMLISDFPQHILGSNEVYKYSGKKMTEKQKRGRSLEMFMWSIYKKLGWEVDHNYYDDRYCYNRHGVDFADKKLSHYNEAKNLSHYIRQRGPKWVKRDIIDRCPKDAKFKTLTISYLDRITPGGIDLLKKESWEIIDLGTTITNPSGWCYDKSVYAKTLKKLSHIFKKASKGIVNSHPRKSSILSSILSHTPICTVSSSVSHSIPVLDRYIYNNVCDNDILDECVNEIGPGGPPDYFVGSVDGLQYGAEPSRLIIAPPVTVNNSVTNWNNVFDPEQPIVYSKCEYWSENLSD